MKREDMEKIDHNMSEEKKQKLTECQKKKKKKTMRLKSINLINQSNNQYTTWYTPLFDNIYAN